MVPVLLVISGTVLLKENLNSDRQTTSELMQVSSESIQEVQSVLFLTPCLQLNLKKAESKLRSAKDLLKSIKVLH